VKRRTAKTVGSINAAITLRGYFARKVAVAVFIVTYIIIAFLGGQHSRRGEYFPVFNWSLFTHVSSVRSLLELYVIQIGDEQFLEPIVYSELGAYFETARIRSTNVKKTLERMAHAARAGDISGLDRIRSVLEKQYLSGRGIVRYEIHLVTFRPVERLRDGRVLERTLIARYTTEANQ